jgi:hypothetical protein
MKTALVYELLVAVLNYTFAIRHGTMDANVNHYAKWSEAYPLTEQEIEKTYEEEAENQVNKKLSLQECYQNLTFWAC